jgi:ribosome-binding protein aMBF1 (putative translation factor)
MFDYHPPPGPRVPDWGAPVEGSPWMRAPERTEPTRSSPRRLLAATELAIVAVTAHDYSAGVLFEIEGRRAPGARLELALGDTDRDEGEDLEPPARLREEFLRFGIADATGAVAMNLPGARWTPRFDAAPSGPVLAGRTIYSTPVELIARWWLWPAPHGELEAACEWPAFGIAETRARLDMRDPAWHGSQPSATLTRARQSHAQPRRWKAEPVLLETYPPHVVAATVKRARHHAGATQEQLAVRLGVHITHVRAMEAAEVQLDARALARVGHVLGTGLSMYYDGMRSGDDDFDLT